MTYWTSMSMCTMSTSRMIAYVSYAVATIIAFSTTIARSTTATMIMIFMMIALVTLVII